MTADANLTCGRCGFSNVPGDVFCGSCGAFLEWDRQPSGAAGAPGGGTGPSGTPAGGPSSGAVGRDPDVPEVGGPTAASEAPTVAWAKPDAAAGGAAGATAAGVVPPLPKRPDGPGSDVGASAAAGAAGLIRCPACGVANQANRTFCQSCGAKLEGTAARVTAPTKEQIAAAVSATNRPAPPAGSAAAGTRAPDQGGSGGALKWILLLAVLGVVVGVGIVVGSSMLKGSGPASDASTAPGTPGASAVVGASGDAPASGDPGTAGASDSPGASTGTAGTTSTSKALKLLTATASSVVGNLEKFQPGMAIDGDPATSWQEGAKQEKGEWIEVAFDPATVDRVVIRNGYGASTALFRGNRRLKDVLVAVGAGKPQAFRLKDTSKAQSIAVTGPAGATTVRITIVSTYPGTKTSVANSPFDDAAVSEIRVFGVVGT